MPVPTDRAFRSGYYGEQVAALENRIATALSYTPEDPLLLRANALDAEKLYLLVTLNHTGKPLFHIEDIVFASMVDRRQQLVEALSQDGWLRLGFGDVSTQLPCLKVPQLKVLAKRLSLPSKGNRRQLLEAVMRAEDLADVAQDLFGNAVFSFSADGCRLLQGDLGIPKAAIPAPPAMVPPPGREPWYHLNARPAEVPFGFRPEHPGSVGFEDFAIWAAFEPRRAAELFSDTLLTAFEYSWRSLLPWTGTLARGITPRDFARHQQSNQLLVLEFRQWGTVMLSAWRGDYQHESAAPGWFKILPVSVRGEPIARQWLMPDGITPRIYRFEELAFQPRDFVDLDDLVERSDEDEDGETLLTRRGFARPNMGIQWAGDFGSLCSMMPGFGFDADGQITFIGFQHLEWERQRRILCSADAESAATSGRL